MRWSIGLTFGNGSFTWHFGLFFSFSPPRPSSRYVFTDFFDSKTELTKKKWNIFGNVQPENFDPLAFSKSVGDYPAGGASQSMLAQWGQDGGFIFYG